MINRIENLAAWLIPYHKWMLIIFLISFVGTIPATMGLMFAFEAPIIFLMGMFFTFLGFAWPWGLFVISYWYNPNGGILTVEKIQPIPLFIRWSYYLAWYYAPIFLVIWFLSPFVVLVMFYPFIKGLGD